MKRILSVTAALLVLGFSLSCSWVDCTGGVSLFEGQSLVSLNPVIRFDTNTLREDFPWLGDSLSLVKVSGNTRKPVPFTYTARVGSSRVDLRPKAPLEPDQDYEVMGVAHGLGNSAHRSSSYGSMSPVTVAFTTRSAPKLLEALVVDEGVLLLVTSEPIEEADLQVLAFDYAGTAFAAELIGYHDDREVFPLFTLPDFDTAEWGTDASDSGWHSAARVEEIEIMYEALHSRYGDGVDEEQLVSVNVRQNPSQRLQQLLGESVCR
jgi:hypothetical protein